MKICPSIFRVFVRTARLPIVLAVAQLYPNCALPGAQMPFLGLFAPSDTWKPLFLTKLCTAQGKFPSRPGWDSELPEFDLICHIYKCFIPPMVKPKQLSCWLFLFHSVPTLQNLSFPQYFPHSCVSPWIFFRQSYSQWLCTLDSQILYRQTDPLSVESCPWLFWVFHKFFPSYTTTMSVLHVCSGQEN